MMMLLLLGCVGARPTITIPDYLIVRNGLEHNGGSLNAFVFENNPGKISIEGFLNNKFAVENYSNREFSITIDGQKYKLILYDSAEFEKYFNSANYAVMRLEPQSSQVGLNRKFIAWSVVSANGEDVLSDDSLFQNNIIKYLQTLKEEYYSNANS